MKKLIIYTLVLAFSLLLIPQSAMAADIAVSGGGSGHFVGDTVTVTVTASGTTFNAFSGTISISGAGKITSTSAGDALWVQKPSGSGDFAGALTSSTTSFRIATIKVQGTSIGTAKLSVSGVKLANMGAIVGSDGGSTSITFDRRPAPPGTITVSSTSHPDQNTAYEATSVVLSWDKPAGVTGYAYLFDGIADTTPPSTVTSADTTKTYDSQAIGIHYFHIKALNGDGWGSVTHFKVQIKEPDPKVSDTLGKPSNITIKKAPSFVDDPDAGTFSGIIISGTTLPNYSANIKLDPLPTIPDNKLMSVLSDSNGHFEFLIDFPVKAGFYKLTVQGQENKTLTPLSDPISFEISLAKGGTINILTASDKDTPVIPAKKWYEKISFKINLAIYIFAILMTLATITITTLFLLKNRSIKKLVKSINIHNS